jgi:hypothetical protein
MPRPHEQWTVLPHGPLTNFDDDILTVQGDLTMPLGHFPRRMTVVRLADRRLVVFSAIALDDTEMRWLEQWGRPAFLVVPSPIHRIDAKPWKERYPRMFVVAPAGARAQAEEVVPVDATSVDFGDPSVRLVTVPGTDEREAALEVRRNGGTTLVINDLIWNLEPRGGVGGLVRKVAGMQSEAPHIPPFVEKRAVRDRLALADQLERWASDPALRRILVSHGEEIVEPRAALQHIAEGLRS